MNGCHGVDFSRLEAVLPRTQLIINTVPCRVLGEKQLALLPKDTPVLDLASKPGGDDVEAVLHGSSVQGNVIMYKGVTL